VIRFFLRDQHLILTLVMCQGEIIQIATSFSQQLRPQEEDGTFPIE
jgi:hypothetical protein